MYKLKVLIRIESGIHMRYAIELANKLKKVVGNSDSKYFFEQYLDVNYEIRKQTVGYWMISTVDEDEYIKIKKSLEDNFDVFDYVTKKYVQVVVCSVAEVPTKKFRFKKIESYDYVKLTFKTPIYLKSKWSNDYVVYPTATALFSSILRKYKTSFQDEFEIEFMSNFVEAIECDRYLIQSIPFYLDYKKQSNNSIVCLNAITGSIRFKMDKKLFSKHKHSIEKLVDLTNEWQIGSKTRYGFGKVKLTFGEVKKGKNNHV